MKKLSYDVIKAAVEGDEEAMTKILAHYAPMIRKYSRGNEEVRKRLVDALRESIRNYDLDDPQKNEMYLCQRFPDTYGQNVKKVEQ